MDRLRAMQKTYFPHFLDTHWWWGAPLLLFCLLAPLTPYIDLSFSSYFFEAGKGFQADGLAHWLYRYGPLFGQVTGGVACLILILSFFREDFSHFKRPALVVFLSLVVGSGLIINGLLKEFWGRPRPRQIEQFGGNHSFRSFYEPRFGWSEEGIKSFPSGHASMGFFFFSLALVGYIERRKFLCVAGSVTALLLGLMLSYARISMGGHFFSDVLASALIMWLVAYGLCRWIYEGR